MNLDPMHVEALDRAEKWMFHSDFCPYFELKVLLAERTPDAHDLFRALYTRYYGLNVGGLTDEFKDVYFEILFSGNGILNGRPDYRGTLSKLSGIRSRTDRYSMPFSFVSKLFATQIEDCPIYDRHVLAFFGKSAPAAMVQKEARIKWYEEFLCDVRQSYMAWADDENVREILGRLKTRDPALGECHVVRLMDFLVWKVGNRKLLS